MRRWSLVHNCTLVSDTVVRGTTILLYYCTHIATTVTTVAVCPLPIPLLGQTHYQNHENHWYSFISGSPPKCCSFTMCIVQTQHLRVTDHFAHLMMCRTLSHAMFKVAALPVTVTPDLRNSRLNRPLGCKSCTPSKVHSNGSTCPSETSASVPLDVDGATAVAAAAAADWADAGRFGKVGTMGVP